MVADPPEFTSPTPPSRAHLTVPHVDGATWPCRLRVAPSRISPGSTIKSQNPSFEGPAPRDRLPRRGIIPPGRAGKRRAGFTRRLLALRIAGLSKGDGKPPRPTRHQRLGLLASIFSVLPHYLGHPADPAHALRGGLPALRAGHGRLGRGPRRRPGRPWRASR